MNKNISWEEVDNHCRELANRFIEEGKTYDMIVGIARGGLVPAVTISHQLGVPLIPVVWQASANEIGIHALRDVASLVPEHSRILVVDDISDSGKTMGEVVKTLNMWCEAKSKPTEIDTAILYRKETGFRTNYVGEVIDDSEWAIFPWESE
jgi:uncharacterized protein